MDNNGVVRQSSLRSVTAPVPALAAPVPLILPEETVVQQQQLQQEVDQKSPTGFPSEKTTGSVEMDSLQQQQQQQRQKQGQDVKDEAASGRRGGFFACCGFGKKKVPEKPIEAVSYWQLYRFASKKDWLYVA
jgi:hypothetical protein